jgi:hypothetical protein
MSLLDVTVLRESVQEECDVIIRRRRAAIQAQGEHDDEWRYADQVVAENLHPPESEKAVLF